MSSNERQRPSKRFRALCVACLERKAKFKYRGEIRADRDHTLCFECHRGEINRARARRLSQLMPSPPTVSPFGHLEVAGGRILDERQLAHRQRMLDYRVVLPVAAYFTWQGTNLEGCGLVSNIDEPLSPEALWSGEDTQLKRAINCLNEAAPAALGPGR